MLPGRCLNWNSLAQVHTAELKSASKPQKVCLFLWATRPSHASCDPSCSSCHQWEYCHLPWQGKEVNVPLLFTPKQCEAITSTKGLGVSGQHRRLPLHRGTWMLKAEEGPGFPSDSGPSLILWTLSCYRTNRFSAGLNVIGVWRSILCLR